jgi:hypothetical protein
MQEASQALLYILGLLYKPQAREGIDREGLGRLLTRTGRLYTNFTFYLSEQIPFWASLITNVQAWLEYIIQIINKRKNP